jgi:hypothetical protein
LELQVPLVVLAAVVKVAGSLAEPLLPLEPQTLVLVAVAVREVLRALAQAARA